MSYPEVYIIGRQVDGIYVECLHSRKYKQVILFPDYDTIKSIAKTENNLNTKDGEWKILKYGRLITTKKQPRMAV